MNWYDIQSKRNDVVDIFLYDVIGKTWDGEGVQAKNFSAELKSHGEIAQINLRINSPGGNVFDGLTIHNILKNHKANVTVYIDGLAASIASVIAMSGNKIIMPSNTMMMIHDPSGLVQGTSEDMRSYADVLDKVKKAVVEAYKARSGLNEDRINKLMTDETWLLASEAKELGFADEIIDEVKMVAQYDLTRYSRTPPSFESIKNHHSHNGLSLEERWNNNIELRNEFRELGEYLAYEKANNKGLTKVYTGKVIKTKGGEYV